MAKEKKAAPKTQEQIKEEIGKLRIGAESILKKIQADALAPYKRGNSVGEGGFNMVYKSTQDLSVDKVAKKEEDQTVAEEKKQTGMAKEDQTVAKPLVISHTINYRQTMALRDQKRSRTVLNRAGLFSPFFLIPLYVSHDGTQISQMAEGGDLWKLFRYLWDNKGKMPVNLARQIVGQIILAFEDIHGRGEGNSDKPNRGIAHRDVKPANILLLEKVDRDNLEEFNEQNARIVPIAFCDPDSFAPIDEAGSLVEKEGAGTAGSPIFSHPDIPHPELYVNEREYNEREYKAALPKYAALNQRKLELYSLGKIVECFIGLKPLKGTIGKAMPPLLDKDAPGFAFFQNLHATLCPENVDDIPDIDAIPDIEQSSETGKLEKKGDTLTETQDAKTALPKHYRYQYTALRASPLFGETPEKRAEFFQKLRAKATQEITSSGFHIGHPVEIGDSFNVIPRKMNLLYNQFHLLADQMLYILHYYECEKNGIQTDISMSMSSLLVEMYENQKTFKQLAVEQGFAQCKKDTEETQLEWINQDIEKMQQWIDSVMKNEPFLQAEDQLAAFQDEELGEHLSKLRKQALELRKLKKAHGNVETSKLEEFSKAASAFRQEIEPLKKTHSLFAGDIAATQQWVEDTVENLTGQPLEPIETPTPPAENADKPLPTWLKRLFKLYQYASPASGVAAAILVGLSIISGPIGWIALSGLAAIVLTANLFLSTGWKRALSGLLLPLAVGACVVMALGLLSNPVGWLMLALTVILPIAALTVWTGIVNYQYSQQIEALDDNLQSRKVASPDLRPVSPLKKVLGNSDNQNNLSIVTPGNSNDEETHPLPESGSQQEVSISTRKISESSNTTSLSDSSSRTPTAPPNNLSFVSTSSQTRIPSTTPDSKSILSGQGLPDNPQRSVSITSTEPSSEQQQDNEEVPDTGDKQQKEITPSS